MRFRGAHSLAVAACCLCLAAFDASARDVVVTLANGAQAAGRFLSEDAEHVIISTDIGEVRIPRDMVRNIMDAPFTNLQAALADSTVLNDQVVVYLDDGSTLEGFVLAKSRGMVMIRNEIGRFTLSKDRIRRIEYISAPFGEKGESVQLTMADGTRQRGFILSETPSTITLITEFGQVAVDKRNLRAMEYGIRLPFDPFKPHKPVRPPDLPGPPGLLVSELLQWIHAGAWPGMGREFGNGFYFGGGPRRPLIEGDAYDVGGSVTLDFLYSGIDRDAFDTSGIPGEVKVEGHSFVFRLAVSAPVFLHMRGPSRLQFYLEPSLDVLLVRKKARVVYLSFPTSSTDERSTDLRFGVGVRAGLEYAIQPALAVGASVGRTTVFGDDGVQGVSIHVTTRPFF